MLKVRERRFPLIATLLGLTCLPMAVQAHYSWLAPSALQAEVDESVQVAIGWGHHPGQGDHLDASRMASLSLWNPDGEWQGLPLHGAETLGTGPLTQAGSYVLAAAQSRGYWSQTIEGGKRGSLQNYPNASQCSYANNSSKALLRVSDSATGEDYVTRPLGQPLEIVPQAIPHRLDEDQPLPVQVLLFGKPLPDATISLYPEDHADDKTPATWTTDAEGRADLDMDQGQRWLAQVETTVPFHDQSLCHQHSLNGTLMFAR